MIVTLNQLKTSLQAVKRYINKIKTTIISGIAEEFDASSSYSAGDYVYYNGKLYKFTADHATGVFDGTDADEVTVTDEMVNDVTVNGTSVVNNGVANIPIGNANNLGVVKKNYAYGIDISSSGQLILIEPTEAELKRGYAGSRRPILTGNQHVSTFYGLAKAAGYDEKNSTESFGTYTEEAKSAIQTMLGVPSSDEVVSDVTIGGNSVVNNGTAEIPILDDYNKYGLPKIGNDDSFTTDSNGLLRIRSATASQVKAGTSTYRALAPVLQHASTFYGLAKAAGADMAQSSNAVGTYTDEAKTAIKSMLGISNPQRGVDYWTAADQAAIVSAVRDVTEVAVSGTDPVITANANTRYTCGEVSTLDFTPCASGICDVVFTSGSTPTVVALPSTVKFPDGSFTPEANKTYEINILNGVYGAVMAWT